MDRHFHETEMIPGKQTQSGHFSFLSRLGPVSQFQMTEPISLSISWRNHHWLGLAFSKSIAWGDRMRCNHILPVHRHQHRRKQVDDICTLCSLNCHQRMHLQMIIWGLWVEAMQCFGIRYMWLPNVKGAKRHKICYIINGETTDFDGVSIRASPLLHMPGERRSSASPVSLSR